MKISTTTSYFKERLRIKAWFYQVIPLLLWMVFAMMPFIIPFVGEIPSNDKGFILDMFYRNILILIIFYVHSYFVYPVLKRRNGLFYYFAGLLLLFVFFFSISNALSPRNFPFHLKEVSNQSDQATFPLSENKFHPRFFHFPIFAVAILCSYSFSLLLSFNKREMILSERENAQLKTELSFLRSQISPHFMFNVLNSMVSLARKNSQLLEPSLINMSNLMRYMLYERNGNVILLKTEIEYLTNYIDLQLLRYGDSLKLNMYIKGNFDIYRIEPMLLLPFVENAFKHGISMIDEPLIDIFLTLNENSSTLQFVVLNSISPVKDMKESETGIGLQNIKRRLELLYPNKYQLNLSNLDDVFKAEIIIKLI